MPVIPRRNRMKNNEYETVEHVDSDLTLMLENAKRYNVPHSTIYKRALKLQHIQQVGSPVRSLSPLEQSVDNQPCTLKSSSPLLTV